MRVLVACEYSGTVRDAFLRAGHDAMSCDLLPTDAPGPHYEGDVLDVLGDGWDLLIAHPPCTYLTNAGVRWLTDGVKDGSHVKMRKAIERWAELLDAAVFFRLLLDAPIERVAVENPVMHRHARKLVGRPADQIVQPYHHGHTETKATGLWLRNLEPLRPTNDVKAETYALPYAERARVHYAAPGPDRWKIRSTTYSGIAQAMADQWGTA